MWAFGDETSSLPNDSMWAFGDEMSSFNQQFHVALFEQIKILSGIQTVYSDCKFILYIYTQPSMMASSGFGLWAKALPGNKFWLLRPPPPQNFLRAVYLRSPTYIGSISHKITMCGKTAFLFLNVYVSSPLLDKTRNCCFQFSVWQGRIQDFEMGGENIKKKIKYYFNI